MSSSPIAPCRLFVILAREAPRAVIFRRGPSQWVQLILWHTDTDTFEYGQWFHGRIYEHRCDLTPDGSKLIYFVNKFSRRTLNDRGKYGYTYAWTAISKPPYLTALALWPKGDCWNGGGTFMDNNTLLLNHPSGADIPHPDHKPQGLQIFSGQYPMGEDFPIYNHHLIDNGWELIQDGKFSYGDMFSGVEVAKPDIWHKKHNSQQFYIEMKLVGFGLYGAQITFKFRLFDEAKKNSTLVPGHWWADWDHKGRLAFVNGGKLFVTYPASLGQMEPTLLADFNDQKPQQMVSPAWARHW